MPSGFITNIVPTYDKNEIVVRGDLKSRICRCCIMVVLLPSKQTARVRFPSPAPLLDLIQGRRFESFPGYVCNISHEDVSEARVRFFNRSKVHLVFR